MNLSGKMVLWSKLCSVEIGCCLKMLDIHRTNFCLPCAHYSKRDHCSLLEDKLLLIHNFKFLPPSGRKSFLESSSLDNLLLNFSFRSTEFDRLNNATKSFLQKEWLRIDLPGFTASEIKQVLLEFREYIE